MIVKSLLLGTSQWQQIVDHVQAHLPEEACGFIGGINGQAQVVLPIRNSLHSPVRFEMDPHEMLQAMVWMEEQELEMLAIFHSHPHGPAVPSPTDLSNHNYPDAACLIVSPDISGPGWQLRAFRMKNVEFEELPVTIGV